MVGNVDYDKAICPNGVITNYDGDKSYSGTVVAESGKNSSALKKPWPYSSLADSDVGKSDLLTDEAKKELTDKL